MALEFANLDIPGEHGPVVFGSPENVTRRVKFFQVLGEGEIRGKPAGRSLSVRVLLHDSWTGTTPTDLLAFIARLDDLIGENDTLKQTGNIEQEYDYCSFEGWEPVPLEGQVDPGPLLDIGATLDAGVNGWFQQVMLHFRQLRVEV